MNGGSADETCQWQSRILLSVDTQGAGPALTSLSHTCPFWTVMRHELRWPIE